MLKPYNYIELVITIEKTDKIKALNNYVENRVETSPPTSRTVLSEQFLVRL